MALMALIEWFMDILVVEICGFVEEIAIGPFSRIFNFWAYDRVERVKYILRSNQFQRQEFICTSNTLYTMGVIGCPGHLA